jgi:two-component system alkaline phosphatase synthesis response regulator PhoP
MSDGTKRRVLIVDDEPSIAKILRKQMEVAGFEVQVAVDGQEGLNKVKEWKPELVILDVMLPKMNGHEVCAAVKGDDAVKQIPIIMLTAKAQRQDQDEALKHGAEGYLTKPFQLEELLAKVNALLPKA